MNLKLLTIVTLSALIGAFVAFSYAPARLAPEQENISPKENVSVAVNVDLVDTNTVPRIKRPYRTTHTGSYISGRFAQQHHDWKSANTYMQHIISIDTQDTQLLLRAMVLAMGSGNAEFAFSMAKKVVDVEPKNSLALLFLTASAFKNSDYEGALSYIAQAPEGGISDFIMPILKGWGNAGQGIQTSSELDANSAHIYHSILIADYMDNHDKIEEQLAKALARDNIKITDIEKIADIYAHIGQHDTALKLYKKIEISLSNNAKLAAKITTLEASQPLKIFEGIASPSDGVALALLETAQGLVQEYSDDSAQVFSNMALYLDPNMVDAKLLLAYIASRYERYEEAISYYKDIPADYEHYLQARREAATLWENIENYDAALLELKTLIDEYGDLKSMIESGNIYRRIENYEEAVQFYNKAAATFGDTIPADYWHIHYLRGMSYERLGKWNEAESDLQKALSYQPNHPLVLNYLGYAWADQGDNLEKALGMINKAAVLRPDDGFIKDSLGWVLYKMTRYQDSVPHLEKAIELMPYDPTINDHLGDAYWRTGRKLEAEFQWKRALNFSEDEELIATIKEKLSRGLPKDSLIKEARTDK